MLFQDKSISGSARVLIYGFCFFFLMRLFTPEFVRDYVAVNIVYTTISKVLAIVFIVNFIYATVKLKKSFSDFFVVLLVVFFYLYLLVVTIIEKESVQHVFMSAYPVLGTLCFLETETKDHYKAVITSFSRVLSFFLIVNLLDMVFIKQALWVSTAVFFVGGRNQMALFLGVTLSFFFATEDEYGKARDKVKIGGFLLLVLLSTWLAGSATCLISMLVIMTILILMEWNPEKVKLNPTVIMLAYLAVWLLLIVFRIQYLFSDFITYALHKDATLSHRTILWDAALGEFFKAPIWGHGMTESENIFRVHHDYTGKTKTGWSTLSAHNEFLQLLYYGGGILAILFWLIYFFTLRDQGAGNKHFKWFFIGVIGSLATWLMEAPGEYAMFLLLAMCYYSRRNVPKASKEKFEIVEEV